MSSKVESKNIKILLLFSSSGIGGAERSLSRMALSNNSDYITYDLATFGSQGDWSKWIDKKSFKKQVFNHKIWALLKYININKPNVIYVIGFKVSIYLRILRPFFFKCKLVQGVRWNPNSDSSLDTFFRIFERLFSSLLDGYIVNSKAAKKILRSLKISNVELIYNGISCSTNKIFNVKRTNIITVANLSHRKGHKDYLQIISKVIENFPSSKFLFLGRDNLNGAIQKLIVDNNLSKNVCYLGFTENIDKYLAQSSFFVLPSKYGEGCPTSILEAFSYKLPVIAYNVDGIPELITNNKDGFIIELDDSISFGKAIEELLRNPNKAKEMGGNGFQKAKDLFMMDKMLNDHNEYFLRFK